MSIREERLARDRQKARLVLSPVFSPPRRDSLKLLLWGCAFTAMLLVFPLWQSQRIFDFVGIGDVGLESDIAKLFILVVPLALVSVLPLFVLYQANERRERRRLADALMQLSQNPVPFVGALCQLVLGGPVYQVVRQAGVGLVDLMGVLDSDGLPRDDLVDGVPASRLLEVTRG